MLSDKAFIVDIRHFPDLCMPTTVYNAHNDSHLCTLWNLQQSNFKIILFSKGFVVKLQILDSHKFNSQAIAITHPLH